MKIGFVTESGYNGAERKILPTLIHLHDATVEFEWATLNTKAALMEGATAAARNLLAEGCDRVLIVWDLKPPHPWGERPCIKREKDILLEELNKLTSTQQSKVFLVCIKNMIEAWLLADTRAIEAAIIAKKKTARPNVSAVKRPEQEVDPKSRLISIFEQELPGKTYVDHIDGPRIAENIPNPRYIKKCPTYKRFILKALGITLT